MILCHKLNVLNRESRWQKNASLQKSIFMVMHLRTSLPITWLCYLLYVIGLTCWNFLKSHCGNFHYDFLKMIQLWWDKNIVSKMGKRKQPKPYTIMKSLGDPKDTIESSLEDWQEAAERFICEVLKLFEDLHKILDKNDK